MPGIDGVVATRHIKNLDALRDIPIIVVTAKTALGDLQTAFSARRHGLHHQTSHQHGNYSPG